MFTGDGCRKLRSPRTLDIRELEPPKSTNASRLRIRQPRRPNSATSNKSPSLFTSERACAYHLPTPYLLSTPAPQSQDDIAIPSVNPYPVTLLPLTRSRTPYPISDDFLPVGHVSLSPCSSPPETESSTDILTTNKNMTRRQDTSLVPTNSR